MLLHNKDSYRSPSIPEVTVDLPFAMMCRHGIHAELSRRNIWKTIIWKTKKKTDNMTLRETIRR